MISILTTYNFLQKTVGLTRLTAIMFVTVLGVNRVSAVSPLMTDTISIDIYYRVSSHDFDADFRDNGDRLSTLLNTIASKPSAKVREVSIVSSASPEGNTLLNRRLSVERSATSQSLLSSLNGTDSAEWHVSSIGIDWQGLAEKVRTTEIGSTDKIEEIITTVPEWIVNGGVVTDGRKLRLKLLDGNRPWQQMERDVFPDLRVSHITVTYTYRDKDIETVSITPKLCSTLNLTHLTPDINVMPAITRQKRDFLFALRTNLAYDLLAIPTLGVEFALAGGWTVGFGGYYAWWSNRERVRYWRVQGAELSLRKYFGRSPLSGHHVGLYSQLLRYDICLGGRGYLSGGSGARFTDNPSWGIGADYGYSVKIGRRLRLDMSVGIGYLSGRYMTYRAIDEHSVFQSVRQRRWFGPTKMEIALAWLIGKGGER